MGEVVSFPPFELDRRSGRRESACAHASRLETLWAAAEPGFAPATNRLRAITGWCRT